MNSAFSIIDQVQAKDGIRAFWNRGEIRRIPLLGAAARRPPTPLIFVDGIDVEAIHMPGSGSIAGRHDPVDAPIMVPPVWCYFAQNLIVSGNGLLWYGRDLLAPPDIMPEYWRERISGVSAHSTPEIDINLPVREISDPCICALGWGSRIYGHVLLEMLPRVIMALEACRTLEARPKVLIHANAPEWLVGILAAIGVGENDLLRFDPSNERVKLSHGVFPGYPGTHPHLPGVFDTIRTTSRRPREGVYYLSRRALKDRRACINEPNLERIAANEFGAHLIAPESIPWTDQVIMFRSAKAVIGLSGSALHTSILADGDLIVGSIGAVNTMQSALCNLRGQRMAYQLGGFTLSNSYSVPENGFRRLMQAICSA